MRLVCYYIYIYLGDIIWQSDISFTLWKSTFRSIKCCCKSDRASKFGCVWFVVMKNTIKVGTG